MENIENIRKNAIAEIKEKVKKNHGYLHPCNKEKQEDMKRFGFENGYKFNCWLQHVGILKRSIDVRHKEFDITIKNYGCKNLQDYQDKCAKKLGFKDRKERGKVYRELINHTEYTREWKWNHNVCSPSSENEDCSLNLGFHTAERKIARKYIPIILEEIEDEMPVNNLGYDIVCKGGIKIDVKARRLIDNKWEFPIKHNNTADYFLLIGFNDDYNDKLKILHIWLIGKNDKIRKHIAGKHYRMEKFHNRETISIYNDPGSSMYFKYFQKYDQMDKLSEEFIIVEMESI